MEVWKKSPLFHGMTEQEIEEILMQEQCRRKKYEKGTFVFLEGDMPKSLRVFHILYPEPYLAVPLFGSFGLVAF